MTFLIIWALILGGIIAIALAAWTITLLVKYPRTHPTLGRWVGWAVMALAVSAYVSVLIYAMVA